MILQIDHLEKRGLLFISILTFPVVMTTASPCWSTSSRETGLRGLSARMRASGSALGSRIIPPLSSRKIRKHCLRKIERHPAVVVKQHFHGGRIDFLAPSTAWACCSETGSSDAASAKPEKEMDNPKASRTDFRNMPWSIEFPIIVVFYIIQRNGVAGRMQTVVS